MNPGIYSITNVISGKVYVGSTIRLKRRWGEHKLALKQNNHHNPHLQSSWDKYSEDSFNFMVCEYVDNQEQLVDREQYWLDFYRMHTDVYNILLVVDRLNGMLGKKHTKETRQQMSISAYSRPLGYRHTEKAKGKISAANIGELNPNYGRVYTDEERDRLSKAHTGKTLSEEHKYNISQGLLNMDPEVATERSRKLSEAGKGRKHTKESKQRMSRAAMGNQNALGHVVSKETRLKLSKAATGRKHTKEAKDKMSKSHKGIEHGPMSKETRQKISASKMGVLNPNYGKVYTEEERAKLRKSHENVSMETRRKLSESGKRAWARRRALTQ